MLQFVTAALSIGAVVAQQKPIAISALLEDLTVSIFLAWVISSGYGRWWALRRAPWWLAHAWLSWLEDQIADPSNPMGDMIQDVFVVATVSPHPALEKWLGNGVAYGETTEEAQAQRRNIELEIAHLARKWRYRFQSEAWQSWFVEPR